MQGSQHAWIEVDKSAFDANIAHIKRVIGNKLLALVIKSNAYGHGTPLILQLSHDNPHVAMICVAMVWEAQHLLALGASKPIFVMNVVESDPTPLVGKAVEFTVSSYENACMLDAIGQATGHAVRVHLKIDTGLGRFGVEPEDAVALARRIQEMPFLRLVGVFTHFAQSHCVGDPYTQHQLATFRAVKSALDMIGIKPPHVHVSNSAATLTLDLPDCTMVRIGAAAYGLWSSQAVKEHVRMMYPGFDLRHIMSWKTRIMFLKRIKKGSYVGYNRTYQASRDMQMAILPVGYYDGYDFRFSNRTKVYVRGIAVPVIGRVCMNQTMIDVTDCPYVAIDDEVTLLGNEQHITVYDIAQLSGRENIREITTTLRHDMPRVLVNTCARAYDSESITTPLERDISLV